MKNTYIVEHKNADGSRNVVFYGGSEKGWYPAGKLMPEVSEGIKAEKRNAYAEALLARRNKP